MSKDKLMDVLGEWEITEVLGFRYKLAKAIRQAGYIHVSEIIWPEHAKCVHPPENAKYCCWVPIHNEAIEACKQSVERSGG